MPLTADRVIDEPLNDLLLQDGELVPVLVLGHTGSDRKGERTEAAPVRARFG